MCRMTHLVKVVFVFDAETAVLVERGPPMSVSNCLLVLKVANPTVQVPRLLSLNPLHCRDGYFRIAESMVALLLNAQSSSCAYAMPFISNVYVWYCRIFFSSQ